MSGAAPGCAAGPTTALPRASAFSPRLRIVAWTDTTSVRRKLMYGSQTSLAEQHRTHSHDIRSSKSLWDQRPQTIPYRPKSGVLSGRPCSAPPPGRTPDSEMKKRENLRVTTLNIALPSEVGEAKPMYNFQPKIPPKKHTPWNSAEYLKGTSVSSNSNVPITVPMPYPLHETQRNYLESDIKKKIKRSRTTAKKDLHISHRIAHLNAQISDAQMSRSGTMLTT